MAKNSTPLSKGALSTDVSKGLRGPVLDDQDRRHQEQLGALTDDQISKAIEALHELGKDRKPTLSFDEMIARMGL